MRCSLVTFTSVDDSELPAEKYHLYSDVTMEHLLESLENLVDDLGNRAYEVEYNVSVSWIF